jgi:hypothetical protein
MDVSFCAQQWSFQLMALTNSAIALWAVDLISRHFERFYCVNLLVFTIGIAVVAVVVVAPIHALYRNIHPLNEGRNFYRLSAMELTRQWHQQSDIALPSVGGDEGLAMALAFYSPDNPLFEMPLVYPKTEALPQANFNRGWAALCFDEDVLCIDSMQRIAARASRIVSSGFVVQSTLLGRPGATQRFRAFIVPPSVEGAIPPSPAAGIVDDVFASR